MAQLGQLRGPAIPPQVTLVRSDRAGRTWRRCCLGRTPRQAARPDRVGNTPLFPGGITSSADTTLPVQPGTVAQVQRSLTASISIRPRPLSSSGSACSVTGALGISSQTSISTRVASANSRRTTTGNPASPYRARPSGPAEARTALVTSSLTMSSAVSANPRRPHSVSTARACRRAHGVAVRKAPSGKELDNGHDGVALCRSLPVSGLSVTAPSRIALRAYPPCAVGW